MALTPKLTALFAAGVLAAFAAGAASAAGMPSKINGPHAKLPCSTCHKNEMTAPPKETCLSCHGSYDKLAERTAAKRTARTATAFTANRVWNATTAIPST